MQANMRRASLLADMHKESVARIDRKWKEIEVPELEVPKSIVPVAVDLDFTGASSLNLLLNTTRTARGRVLFQDWMLYGAAPDEIKLRQESVAELAEDEDFRIKFRLLCEQLAISKSGPEQFVGWCESDNWLDGKRWILWLARITSVVVIITILLLMLSLIHI